MMESRIQNKNELIRRYFTDGYKYAEIVNFLHLIHGISLSIRQLKRILQKMNLKRKQVTPSPLYEVCAAIIEELNGSGKCLGYKTLWRRLQTTYGLTVNRDIVWRILKIADPEGVNSRAKRRLRKRNYIVPGPNFLWHMDGYDKLKPFGFAVHACIDGFSRKILWVHVATSNNNPKIIAYYFLRTVERLGIVPTLLRSDMGTENSIVGRLQQCFRIDHGDALSGTKSYIVGKSTSNQRIECFWSQMRRLGGDFWISYFKDLRDCGLFQDSDQLHVECLRYCFGPLIQRDLTLITTEWNRHTIRKQKNNELPSGKPNCLYFLPETFGYNDYKKEVDMVLTERFLEEWSEKPMLFNPLFKELANLTIPNTKTPSNVDEALDLYTSLITAFNSFDE